MMFMIVFETNEGDFRLCGDGCAVMIILFGLGSFDFFNVSLFGEMHVQSADRSNFQYDAQPERYCLVGHVLICGRLYVGLFA